VTLQHPIIIIVIIIIMRLSEAAAFSWAWTTTVVLPAMVGGSTSSHHLRSLQDGRIVGVRHFVVVLLVESPTSQSINKRFPPLFSLHTTGHTRRR
jgi:hypothetical protein